MTIELTFENFVSASGASVGMTMQESATSSDAPPALANPTFGVCVCARGGWGEYVGVVVGGWVGGCVGVQM